MDLGKAVHRIVASVAVKPIGREQLHAVATSVGAEPNVLYNALLIRVARDFLTGDLPYDRADHIANSVWSSITGDIAEYGDDYKVPQPAYAIFQAFDAGEWDRGDGSDPVEQYTRPELKAVLSGLEPQ